MKSDKYYVVWKGLAPGVYDSWDEAEEQIKGFPGAQYRSFKSQEAAVEAFREGYDKEGLVQEMNRELAKLAKEGTVIPGLTPIETSKSSKSTPSYESLIANGTIIADSIAVDAACSKNPGPVEYRGVYVRTGEELFRVGPLQDGTNNIGEFLAIVHCLALQEKQGTRLTIYSDSVNAQLWVKQGICKTKLEETATNAKIFDMLRRAETWLRTHSFRLPIIKWETKQWGEIPADFGRK